MHRKNRIRLQTVNPADFNQYADVLDLLQKSFAYMEGRIDPPSSLHRIDLAALVTKAEDETLIVALEEVRIVGCVFAVEKTDCIYLGKLAVDSSYRGQGIATRLIESVESLAMESGSDCVDLETRVELLENQRFFERLGYVKVAGNSHRGYTRDTSFRYRKKIL